MKNLKKCKKIVWIKRWIWSLYLKFSFIQFALSCVICCEFHSIGKMLRVCFEQPGVKTIPCWKIKSLTVRGAQIFINDMITVEVMLAMHIWHINREFWTDFWSVIKGFVYTFCFATVLCKYFKHPKKRSHVSKNLRFHIMWCGAACAPSHHLCKFRVFWLFICLFVCLFV